MSTIAEVRLRLKAEGGKVVAQEVDQVGDSIEGLGDASDRVEKKTGGLLRSIGGFAKQAGRAAGLGLGALGAQSVVAGIKFNQTFEDMEAVYKTFLGEVRGAEFADELRELSNDSGLFRLTDFMESAQRLLSVKMDGDDVISTLEGVGMAAAVTPDMEATFGRVSDVFADMVALGTVSRREINRLSQAGVNVNDILQDKFNLTNEQLRNIGNEGIAAEEVIKAISEGWTDEYAEAYENRQKTLSARTMTMIKTFEQFQREALEPVAEILKTEIIPRVTDFIELLIDLPQEAKTAAVGASLIAGALAGAAFLGVGAPIILVGAALAGLGYLFVKNRDAIIDWGKGAIEWITGVGDAIWEWVSTAAENVAGFVTSLIPVQVAITLVEGAFKTFSPIVKMHLKIAGEYVKFFWEVAKIAFEGVWIVIKTGWNIVKRLGAIIGNVVGIVSNLLRGDFAGAWENAKGLMGNVVGIVTDAWEGFLEFFGTIPGRIFDLIKTIPGRIAGVAAILWDGFKDSFRGFLDWLKKEAEKIKETVVDAVPKPLRDAFDFSSDVGGAFFKGFLGAGANGLIADRPGFALVGERGPELVRLGKGDTVIPNEISFPGGGETVIRVPLYLDGRKVAEATARHVANAAAAA